MHRRRLGSPDSRLQLEAASEHRESGRFPTGADVHEFGAQFTRDFAEKPDAVLSHSTFHK